MTQTGSYILLIHLPFDTEINLPTLGEIGFPAGFYAYAASDFSEMGLSTRIKTYLSPTKHAIESIDYLLQNAKVEEVWMALGTEDRAHDWTSLLLEIPGAISIADGFGVSHCQCESHLVYFDVRPELEDFEIGAKRRFPNDILISAITGSNPK